MKGVKQMAVKVEVTATMRVRAILALQTGVYNWAGVKKSSEQLGFKINNKAFSNNFTRFPECFKKKGKGISRTICNTKTFYKKFEHELPAYIQFLPDKEEQLKSAFGMSSDKPIEEETSRTNNIKIRPKIVYCAILAAYEKPLSVTDIHNISIKRGFDVKKPTIGFFMSTKKDQIIKDGYRGNAALFKPLEAFFKSNIRYLDDFIEALPDKKVQIIKNFRQHVILPERYKDIKPEEPQAHPAAENQQLLSPETENQETDMIDAANVGAAIIAYINKLRKARNTKDYDDLKHRNDNYRQTIINQTNEINNLNYQLDKLRKNVDDSNQRIIELNHQVSVLKNKLIEEQKALPGTFKMSDVARITKVIKRPNKNNGS